jgi:hypothetical protein
MMRRIISGGRVGTLTDGGERRAVNAQLRSNDARGLKLIIPPGLNATTAGLRGLRDSGDMDGGVDGHASHAVVIVGNGEIGE